MAKTKAMTSFLIKPNDIQKVSNNDAVTKDKQSYSKNFILEPPFDFSLLIGVFDTHFLANKAVDIFAKKVAYTGFDVVTDLDDGPNPKKDDTKQTKNDNLNMEAQIEKVEEFLGRINPDKTFEDIMYSAAIDYKITGNYAIEVARGIDGQVKNLYNIPINTARVLIGQPDEFKTGQRYAQVFYNQPENSYISYNKYYPNKDDRTIENGFGEELNIDVDTHEMIWGKNANPGNQFYGYSPSQTVTRSYLIKKYIDNSNIQEFENSFLNRFAIIIEEGTLTQDSVGALQDYLSAIKDDQDWTAIPVIHNPSGRIRIEKLGDSIRDGSYMDLRDKVNEEVIVAFGVPPILLGIVQNSTQANQLSQEKKFYYEEVLPFQKMFFKIINRMLQEDLGFSGIEIQPKIPSFKDRSSEIDVVIKGIEKGLFSINGGRKLMGEKPLLDVDGNEDKGAGENYVYIGGKPVPVKDLVQFTGDTAVQINLTNLLEQTNQAGESLAKGLSINKEIENSKIDYDEV